MNRRQFFRSGVTAAVTGAAVSTLGFPMRDVQAADFRASGAGGGAATTPAILASYTAEDHRRRLTCIGLCTKQIRRCLRKHLIADYLPAQCVYNMGEYPSR